MIRLLKRLPNNDDDNGDDNFRFEFVCVDDEHPPPYAILSHTWLEERQEVTYQDIKEGTGKDKQGYDKIRFCMKQAAEDGIDYCWIDTCCIDKSTFQAFQEVQTAINSMFRWYQRARKCYVYLSDVEVPAEVTDVQEYRRSWMPNFRRSTWFTRGWTLQELLAPTIVVFFSKDGTRLGDRISLERAICEVTGIPSKALKAESFDDFSFEARMSWVATRTTTVREDKVYCLLGIFGVFLVLNYGEGESNAQRRLKEEIRKRREGCGTARLEDLEASSTGREDELQYLERTSNHEEETQSGPLRPVNGSSASKRLLQQSDAFPPDLRGVDSTSKRAKNAANDHDIARLPDQQLKEKLKASLCFDQIDDRFKNIKTGLTKTCTWLLKERVYVEWLNASEYYTHHGIFWIKGKPGCGKSILTKFALEHARLSSKDKILSFFFNARGVDLEKHTTGLYRSLIVQMLDACPDGKRLSSIPSVQRWFSHENNNTDPELLKRLFIDIMRLTYQRNVVLVVDALDECDEDEIRDMIQTFEELGENAEMNGWEFRVLFSSRPYPNITVARSVEFVLEEKPGHSQDLERYIKDKLRSGRTNDMASIRCEILDRSSGIFLWVVLVVDILNRTLDHGHIHAVREKLREIPTKLNKLLKDMLMRDRQYMDEMLLCLQWILYAARPLKREELYFGILSDLDLAAASRPWDPSEITHEFMESFILSSSKGLAEITIKSKDCTVQFIHESVRDFLIKEHGLSQIWSEHHTKIAGLSQDRLKRCCYRYSSSDFTKALDLPEVLPVAFSAEGADLRKLASSKFPFLEYATQHMFAHADIAQKEGVDQKLFLQGLDLPSWIYVRDIVEKFEVRRFSPDTSLAYVCAEQDYTSLLDLTITEGWAKDGQGGRHANPVFAAMATKNLKAFRMLVDADARRHPAGCEFPYPIRSSKNAYIFLIKQTPELIQVFLSVYNHAKSWTNQYGEALLRWAFEHSHVKIAELLLSQGISLEPQDTSTRSALDRAMSAGQVNVVELLLEAGADASGALSIASAAGHGDMVKLLLDREIGIDSEDPIYGNALQAACFKGHYSIVEFLLSRGADINGQGGHYGSALQAASAAYYNRLPLERDFYINTHGGYHANPLQAACVAGHYSIVEFLLSRGADIDSQGGYYSSALLAASAKGHNDIVKLLLDRGIGIESQDAIYGNALQVACIAGRYSIVEFLLSRGADINAPGGRYGNALQAASISGLSNTVKLLLDKGAKVNVGGGFYGSALQAASAGLHNDIVELLLGHGADVNLKGGEHGSALEAAVPYKWGAWLVQSLIRQHQNKKRLLLAREAADCGIQTQVVGDTDLEWTNFPTPIVSAEQRDLIVMLLKWGANTDTQNGRYGFAVHQALDIRDGKVEDV